MTEARDKWITALRSGKYEQAKDEPRWHAIYRRGSNGPLEMEHVAASVSIAEAAEAAEGIQVEYLEPCDCT